MAIRFVWIPIALLLLVWTAACAQPPFEGRRDRGGPPGGGWGDRGDRGGGGDRGDRGNHNHEASNSPQQDAERRAQFMEMMLRRMDNNNDGIISPDELDPRRKAFFDSYAQRVGLNPNQPIAISAFKEAAIRSAQQQPQAATSPVGAPPTATPSGASPAKPGSAPATSTIPGFGTPVRPGTPASVAAPGFASVKPSSPIPPQASPPRQGPPQPNADNSARVKQFAESMMRQYDKNKNGRLEKEEWSQMRENLRDGADRDHDGIITQEELSAKLLEYSQKRDGGGRSGRPDGPGASSSTVQRKSYRFLSPSERLPQGLPDWFSEKDTNQDGQISMAEYSRAWTEAVADEFGKFDLNRDGVVTPRECLSQDKMAAASEGRGDSRRFARDRGGRNR